MQALVGRSNSELRWAHLRKEDCRLVPLGHNRDCCNACNATAAQCQRFKVFTAVVEHVLLLTQASLHAPLDQCIVYAVNQLCLAFVSGFRD